MSSQLGISPETLAEAFIDATSELELKNTLAVKNIIIPNERIIDSLAKPSTEPALAGSKTNKKWVSNFARYNPSFSSDSIGGVLNEALEKAASSRKSMNQWLNIEFKKAKDKLKALAGKILEKAKEFGVSALDFLERIRRNVYKWIVQSSVVDSLEIEREGNEELRFAPKKISTSGTFTYGSISSEITTVADIIGFLKILPSISIKIDVEYGQ